MRRRITPKFWIFMIITTAVVFAVSFGVLNHLLAQGRQRLARENAYRDDLILQIQDLNDELEYTRTDDFIMRAARDELGMIMPNEIRYVNSSK